MTDPNLAEQAEREIAEESGLDIRFMKGRGTPTHKKLVDIAVRDRCSLLKLRKAAEGVIAASFAGSSEPWDKAVAALRSALEGK